MPDGSGGAGEPGLPPVAAPQARAWAQAAARLAADVPASGAEADAWTVRGWADVAVGCLALDSPVPDDPGRRDVPAASSAGAFGGLDEVIHAIPVASGGQHARRLRRLRQVAGPVPAWYPDIQPAGGPIRGVRPVVWRAAQLVAGFGELLMAAATALPREAPVPLVSADQLAWGFRYRPSPADKHVTVHLPVDRWLARRTWMCLPGPPGAGTVIAEVPSTATPLEQQIWRGIHEGAHLDHLAFLAGGGPQAPSPEEFGRGLLVAESYAMAVEILAAVECVLDRQGGAVRQLGAGLIERAARLPGSTDPAAEFLDLPTLAEVYLVGPLKLLTGAAATAGVPSVLPGGLAAALGARWRRACASYPPAIAFTDAAAALLGRAD
jgi:hypothetical protein